MKRLSFRIARDHPCGEDHFPGNPIVPGAVLLDEVIAAIERATGRAPVAWTVVAAKFLQPVRPGDALELGLEETADGGVRFECLRDERAVLSGRVHPTRGEAD